MGLSMKMAGLPFAICMARRKFSSSIGPRTNPRIMGAGWTSIFLKKYPARPHPSMSQTEKTLLMLA